MWYWGLIAGAAAVWQEYLFRTLNAFWAHLWQYVPVQIVIAYGIYRIVTFPGTSLLDAMIIFGFSTALLRVLVTTLVLGDVVTTSTWVAFGLLVLARLVQIWGKL